MATPSAMGWTSGSFYVAGSVAASVTTIPAWPAMRLGTAVLLCLICLGAVIGLGLMRWGHHLPRWGFHLVVGQATLLLAMGVLLSVDDVAAMAIAGIFVFCAVDNLYFFARRAALAHTALLLSAVVASLFARGITWEIVTAVVVVQVVIVLVVGRLAQQASDSTRDYLTDLPNRRGFDAHLEASVRAAQRADAGVTVALVDIDNFKDVNDSSGHAAGDALLRTVSDALSATLLRSLSRSEAPGGPLHTDHGAAYLARLGGDEFGLILPGVALATALEVAESMRRAALPVGLSVGVAEGEPSEGVSALVRRADTALYEAKAAGRGQVRAARAVQEPLLRDLVAAIAADRLEVALQPVVQTTTARMVGVEALARWHHPVQGPISPGVFVPLAEAHGLVIEMGQVLAQRAVRAAAVLAAARQEPLLLSLNASGKELVDPRYVTSMLALLTAESWPAARLVIEVTESVVEASSAPALQSLEQLRAAGVRIAIDDFGTGYSTLSQLDSLPADFLKLDSRFTADLLTSPRRRAVLTGLLRMCDDLDLTVIAEGVESAKQARLIDQLGVPLAQGYLYQRPAPLADVIRYDAHAVLTDTATATGSDLQPS